MIKRVILGTMLILQGLIHLLGFVAYWRLAEVEGLSYGTRLLSGSLEVGHDGIALRVGGLEEREAVDPPDVRGDARGELLHARTWRRCRRFTEVEHPRNVGAPRAG